MSTARPAHEVLRFWFGSKPYTAAAVRERSRLWFGDPQAPELTPQHDELIRERFAETLEAARRGELLAWESGPRRRLALILVLDQFPRNVHRGLSRAFASDAQALALTVTGMQLGADATLDPLERAFFYMPLQHAESGAAQEESVAAFRRLAAEAPPELAEFLRGTLEFALAHERIITRFGRFPHRNRALGRISTREESDWLGREGPRFGQ